MARARRLAPVLVVALAVGLLAAITWTRPAAAAPEKVTGAGSTFAKIAIDQWVRDVSGRGLQLNYQGPGSSQGRNLFKGKTVDWASSDIAFEPEEQPVGRPFTYLPLVAGGTALMYNLVDTAGRQIDSLALSGRTVARIFTGQIRNWRDPDILKDNEALAPRIPDQDIKTVVRSGGSGTSAVFTGYMAAVAGDVWAQFASQYGIPGNFVSNYPDVPGFIKQPGSSEIATFVANPNAGRGSIGYAEAGYAHQARIPIAYVDNKAGKWTLPTARNVAVALLEARRNPDGTQDLSNVYFNGREETYAISSYNYMIAPTDVSEGKGETLVRFIAYAVSDGQAKAAPLGYSPLPPNLCDQALQEALKIPAPAAAHDEARAKIGSCGNVYQQLDVQKPRAVPNTPGVGGNGGGGGGGGDGGSGPTARTTGPAAGPAAGSASGAGATATTVAGEATVTETEVTAEEELGGLATRLQTDESGRAVLGTATLAALSQSENRTGALLLGGVVLLAIFFVPPIAGQVAGRRKRGPT